MRQISLVCLIIFSLSLTHYAIEAETSPLQINLDPSPSFNQIVHGETYKIKVFFNTSNIKLEQGDLVKDKLSYEYTGNYFILLTLKWIGRGSYDFGKATTGYVMNLDPIQAHREYSQVVAFSNDVINNIEFNYTFTRDAYEFGMKPFEEVNIKITVGIYFEEKNQNTGIIGIGSLLASTSNTYYLLDWTKINYINGKYQDMEDEVNNLNEINDLETFDKKVYFGVLEDMNNTLEKGDYFEAYEIYRRYDEKIRTKFIKSLIGELNNSLKKIEELNELPKKLDMLEAEIDFSNTEYESLESRYTALLNTYQKKQGELESSKKNLSTAITTVLILSVIFFFLGRLSNKATTQRKMKIPRMNNNDKSSIC
jgi:hypothetical protein